MLGKLARLALLAALLALMLPGGAAVSAQTPATLYYGDLTASGWTDFPQVWDATACDLTISYTLDMSAYAPPMGSTAWTSVGVAGGAWGWMSSGAPAAAETNPDSQDIDDKLNLGAPDRYDESSYDATGPETLVTPPIGNPWMNFGVWFDRDGVDPYQAANWGMIDGVTYNTGGVYQVAVSYHAIDATEGTMFATVNGVHTGFYDAWKNAPPDHYPAGKSFSGDLANLQVFANVLGSGVKVLDLTVTGCLVLEEGMATGGGWFIPEADNSSGLTLDGSKATFAFVAKHKDSRSTGQLEFQYHGDGLNLKSTSYDWVALSATQVIFEGEGDLNGQPGHRFRVQAFDGDPDRFTIRIWTGGGSFESPTYRAEGDLGGGQIVVHKK